MADDDLGWMSTNNAAARIGVTSRTVYRFIDADDPPAHKSGRVTTSVTTGPGHHRLGLFDQARPSPANAHPIRARPVDPARRVYPAGIFDTEASL